MQSTNPVVQETTIPPETALWWGVAVAHIQGRDWHRIIYRLDDAEIIWWIGVIEDTSATLDDCLDALGLPPLEGPGFWKSEVLPVLERSLHQPTARRYMSGQGSIFESAKAIARVEDVASRYTDLIPAGPSKLKGRCPLHYEKTPSFHIYIDEQRWRCYGACGDGGDVIELVRRLIVMGKWKRA